MTALPAHPPPSSIWAGGGAVYRSTDGKSEFLVAHRPRYDDFTLAKGKLDPGESFADAALREVFEETGMKCILGPRIGSIGYLTAAGNRKVVRYWLMEAVGGEFKRNAEVDAIEWLRPRKARARLSYPRDRAVLNRAVELLKRPDSGRVFLVRHALAGERRTWTKPDRLRPLSKRGHAQALAIADTLSNFPITRVLTSPATRCEQTVAPYTEQLGIRLETAKALREGATPKKTIDLIKSLTGESAVLCTHGDVVNALLQRLSRKGVRLDGPIGAKKGSIWVFETRSGKVRRGRYLAPT